MADIGAVDAIVADALDAVRGWASTVPGALPLGSKELERFAGRRPLAGWRMKVRTPQGEFTFDVLACTGFPWEPVRIAPSGPSLFLQHPHAEKDGLLCLTHRQTTIDPRDPVAVALVQLSDAAALLADLETGGRTGDFREEFLSYWSWAATNGRKPVVSLCEATGGSREIRLWRGKKFLLVADDEASIESWLANRGRKASDGPLRLEPALFEPVPLAPLPREYPATAADVRAFLGRFDPAGPQRLDRFLLAADGDGLVVLSISTPHGSALAGVRLLAPQTAPRRGDRNPITAGFRPGRLPHTIRLQRLSGGVAERLTVDRADAAWVHGRGNDPRFTRLRESHVIAVGCGSLGSPVIRLLAQAGVGRLTIIDPALLGFANVGRHELGVDSVGQAKATALASELRRNFPHIGKVEAWPVTLQEALAEHEQDMATADLVIATTGSWSANVLLADWRDAMEIPPPALFGWAEPHACAGHSLLLPDGCGDFHAGFDTTGVPLFTVTTWKSDTLAREPACGAVYQPYGPVELSFIAALVADAALDYLVDPANRSLHRMWAARQTHVAAAGGTFSKGWIDLHGESGGMLAERDWPHRRTEDMREVAAA